jgi:hypothetical protein
MGKVRRILRVVGKALVILFITLLLTEVVFRVYNHFYPSFIFYDPSYNRYRGRPNSLDYDFRLNSQGFKDVEFKTQKDQNTYRILGLGDSFAFGVVPYQYNYLTMLEETLNRGGQKTEIINMGIPATGPKDYLALLANEGVGLKPDMVLVSFFIGNDFPQEPGARRLVSLSYVASFIGYLVAVSKGYEGLIVHGSSTYDDDAPTFTVEKFEEIETTRSHIFEKRSQVFASDFETTMKFLIQIKQLCDRNHIALRFVLIPDEEQVNRTLQARVLQLMETKKKPDDFDFTLPNRLLAARLKDQNIEFVDLLDEFARAGTQAVLYKPRNTHWNIAGNRLAAETIARELFHVQDPKIGAVARP